MKLTKRGERVKFIATVIMYLMCAALLWYVATVDVRWFAPDSIPIR